MLSQDNLASNAMALHAAWGFGPGDVLLHALPIFHVHGLFVALHTAILNASEVLFFEKFDLDAVRAALGRATVMMGVPTFYTRLLQHNGFGAADCEKVRLFISGSAPLAAATHEAFAARTGHAILERYGMSEAGMITSNPLYGDRIAGTVGFPLPGVEVRVTGPDSAPMGPGETGAVEVRGPNVFKGYWRMPEKTRAAFRDGWFSTGDLGFLSEDGRLSLVAREKDLIIAGGYNIYPKEVEDALNAAAGVAECAVIGAPHADLGEGVVAVLVAEKSSPLPGDATGEGGAVDALAPALERLAKFKRPRRIIWVDALPRNAWAKS